MKCSLFGVSDALGSFEWFIDWLVGWLLCWIQWTFNTQYFSINGNIDSFVWSGYQYRNWIFRFHFMHYTNRTIYVTMALMEAIEHWKMNTIYYKVHNPQSTHTHKRKQNHSKTMQFRRRQPFHEIEHLPVKTPEKKNEIPFNFILPVNWLAFFLFTLYSVQFHRENVYWGALNFGLYAISRLISLYLSKWSYDNLCRRKWRIFTI